MAADLVCLLWHALELELPLSRRAHGARILYGGKTLGPAARASILRAMARSFVESRYCPVRRDARHDPVELVSCALELWILRSEVNERSIGEWALDLALRVVGFRVLFRLPSCSTDSRALAAFEDRLGKRGVGFGAEFLSAQVRGEARVQSMPAQHADAVLAEIVVLGSSSRAASGNIPIVRAGEEAAPILAQPYAGAIALIARDDFGAALVALEKLLAAVPGHALALEQAARCCSELEDVERAAYYMKRAASIGRATAFHQHVGSRKIDSERQRACQTGLAGTPTTPTVPQRLEAK